GLEVDTFLASKFFKSGQKAHLSGQSSGTFGQKWTLFENVSGQMANKWAEIFPNFHRKFIDFSSQLGKIPKTVTTVLANLTKKKGPVCYAGPFFLEVDLGQSVHDVLLHVRISHDTEVGTCEFQYGLPFVRDQQVEPITFRGDVHRIRPH